MAELERTLSFPVILVITINSIMGTGIFFLPALAAAEAGPGSVVSWLIMAAIAMVFGLVFAELVGMYPKAGGIYEYTKQAFGSFWSFLFGWMTLVAGNITIAMLVVGAVRYLNPGLSDVAKIVVSIAFVLLFNFMAYRGMKTSAVMLVAFGIVTLGTLLSLIIPGILSFEAANFTPFVESWPAVLFTVFLIAETFFGWETATFLAEETKDAERVMPRALWLGTLLIAVIVLVFVVVSLGNIPSEAFGASQTPLTDLAAHYFGSGFSVAGYSLPSIISLLVYLSIIGSVAGWIVSAPRLIMSLAKDKLFIAQMAAIHPTYSTPHKAILFQAVVTSLLVVVGAGSYETLLHLLVPMVLIMYAGVLVSFLLLRVKARDTPRPFRFHFGAPLALLALLGLGAMIALWVTHSPAALGILGLGASFVLFGVPVFLLLTFYYNPEAVIRFSEAFAYVSLLLENLVLPKRIRREILGLFKNLEERHVLDYGAGVGTLTLQLAEHVGPRGHVTATDMSRKNITILERRLERIGVTHVTTIHDPHQVNRVHPGVREVDLVFSVGMLSYIQDLQKVLKDVARVLPAHGKVCFVEYVDFFRLIPNPKWLDEHETLKELFKEAGFAVQVAKLHGLFWNYLFIYGHKRGYEEKDVPFI